MSFLLFFLLGGFYFSGAVFLGFLIWTLYKALIALSKGILGNRRSGGHSRKVYLPLAGIWATQKDIDRWAANALSKVKCGVEVQVTGMEELDSVITMLRPMAAYERMQKSKNERQ